MNHPTLRRSLTFLVGLTGLGALTAGLVVARQPVRYQASISFAVNRISRVASGEYQYDGYYAIQAADLLSQTVVSWFSTPSVLREVYERAGLTTPIESLSALPRRFKTRKYAAQNIVVTFRESTDERANKIAQAVTETMQNRASALNQTADEQALFEIVGSKPVIVRQPPAVALTVLAGASVGFLAGLAVLSLGTYLRSLAAG